MRDVPTDLLRAFVTVIDLGGHTRAGEQLGRAQPTVSLQIKRLQELIGAALFTRESGIAHLTEAGEICAAYARRILAQHDEMLHRLSAKGARNRLKIGIPNDYADRFLPEFLQHEDTKAVRFDVSSDVSTALLRDFHEGLLDIVLALTPDALAIGALTTWRETLSWVAAPGAQPGPKSPVRLVVYPEGCLYRRTMLSVLQRQGRPFDIVYTTSSLTSIEAALQAGFGVTSLARRIVPPALVTLEPSEVLPELPDVTAGIYVSGRAPRAARHLAQVLADVVTNPPAPAPAPPPSPPGHPASGAA
jgi:DNA-binding transcriptional LysR family regulator